MTSYQIFDSLLRPRQTQTLTGLPLTGPANVPYTEVTDTYYDSRGNAVVQNAPYPVQASPSAALLITADAAIPSETVTSYDGAGRVTAASLVSGGKTQSVTATSYPGADAVTVIPPAGATITTTYTDGRGRTTETDQYHSKTTAGGAYDATAYAYDPVTGQLAATTDAAGNKWSAAYDLLGRQVSVTSPDTGTAKSTYNDLGELTSVTDAAGHVVSYAYDAAGRQTGEFAAAPGSQSGASQLDAYTYDTAAMNGPGTALAYGLPATQTAYIGGTGGEKYTTTINAYDPAGHPVSTTYTIPSGTTTGPLAGSYTFGASYTTDGRPATQTYAAAGPLPQETVTYGYNNLAQPDTTFGTLKNGTILPGYVWNAAYTTEGQTAEIDLADTAAVPFTRINDDYDTATGRAHRAVRRAAARRRLDTGHRHHLHLRPRRERPDRRRRRHRQQPVLRLRLPRPADRRLGAEDRVPVRPVIPARRRGHRRPGALPADPRLRQHRHRQRQHQRHHREHHRRHPDHRRARRRRRPPPPPPWPTPPPAPRSRTPRPPRPPQSTAASPPPPSWTGPGTASSPATSPPPPPAPPPPPPTTGTAPAQPPAQLASATTAAGTTTYRYDATGNLLLVRDPATTTLYLPGEELTTPTGGSGAITPTRYYTFNGQAVAARTTTTDITWLAADPQGTTTTAIDSAAQAAHPAQPAQAVTRRYYTPYGQLLATAGTAPVPGTRGFVGGTADPATGLTSLGARQYNPADPAFISPDPVLNPYAPTDLNPYAYAYNNPATDSDPTGLAGGPQITNGGTCTGSIAYCENQDPGDSSTTPFYDYLPPTVIQAYTDYLGEQTEGGHYATKPYMQWKALDTACADTQACTPTIASLATTEAATTWTQTLTTQRAQPKPPLWEIILGMYTAAAVGASQRRQS